MQSILRRHFWYNFGMRILMFVGMFVLFGGIITRFHYNELLSDDLITGMYTLMFALFIVIGDSKSKQPWLPEAIYIMPISRNGRKHATKSLFRMYWLGMSMLMLCTTVIPTIGKLLSAGNVSWKTGCLVGFQFIMALLTACPFLYMRYIEIVENIHIVTILIVTMGQLAVNIIVLGGILDGEMGTGLFLFIAIVCVGIGFVNIWFYKRFYNEMVQFYSEYESSRRLIDIKNLKDYLRED